MENEKNKQKAERNGVEPNSDSDHESTRSSAAAKPVAEMSETRDRDGTTNRMKFSPERLAVVVSRELKPSDTSASPLNRRAELIISHARADLAASDVLDQLRGQKIEHVDYLVGMDQRIKFTMNDKAPEFQLHLVSVPEDEETWKINYLQFIYRQSLEERLRRGRIPPDFAATLVRPDLGFIVQPNHEIQLASTATVPEQVTISANGVRFTSVHDQYKRMLGIPPSVDNPIPVKIALLDSGVAADFPNTKTQRLLQTNLVDEGPNGPARSATDNYGHGTVMCKIIRDLAPFATLHVFKVFSDQGRSSEWHILQALQMLDDANIVNMSITFGRTLGDIPCAKCGHRNQKGRLAVSQRVMSAVFHNQVRQLVEREGRVLVASAGNRGLNELEYPSRFDEVFAISSVNSRCERSSFSNYNGTGSAHPRHYAFPGGETEAPEELVATFGADTNQSAGTSHAAAYASGLLAHLWHQAKPEDRNPKGMTSAMSNAAHRGKGAFANYDGQHGNGIPTL